MENGDKKKKTELAIFRLAIDGESYKKIDHQDKPDFWVEGAFRSTQYGVEITELFASDTEARISKVSGYVDDLLDHRRFRHKDDIRRVDVRNIILEDANGKRISVPALVREHISFKEYRQLIAQRIIEKDAQCNNYISTLQFCLLVIRDRTKIFRATKFEHFFSIFFSDDLLLLIAKSKFRELFLLIEIENKLYKVPLKGMILISRFYFFLEIQKDDEMEEEETDLCQFMRSFAEFLVYEGFQDVYIERSEREITAICGCWGLAINDNVVTIKDYTSFVPDPSTMERVGNVDFGEDERAAIENLRKNFGFATNFAFVVDSEEES